ncbi:glycosyltransferase [Bacteroidales bacterium SW292]|nr:glycosyltransferase [Bacteroidales bacterium SW292]
MRIVEIIPQLGSGGGERFTVDLCNELSKQHEVILIVFYPLEVFGFFANDLAQQIKIVSMDKKKGMDILLPLRLYRTITRFNPDIVHTHLRSITYTLLTALCKQKNIVFFHTVHNTADKEAGGWVNRCIRRFSFKHNLIKPVTISKESQRSFVDFYRMDAPMVFNGRNIPANLHVSTKVTEELKKYQHSFRTRLLVCLARVMPVKRQGLVARICRRLYDEGYDFSLLFIGRYDTTSDLVSEIKDAECPVVYLLGERLNPLEYLKAADGFCLMSSYEGMPISLIEALGTGTVPVCTPVGGVVDVVQNGENGFLSQDLTEEACYNALKQFLKLSDKDLQDMKQKAFNSYHQYSMTDCAIKYVNLFQKSLRGKK